MTILELLVVIGIMAVLFAILTSLVSTIRNSAKAATCANNERMIYTAMVSFASEHDGNLPVPAWIGESVGNNGNNVAWAMDSSSPLGLLDFTAGTLWPYMPPTIEARKDAVHCPADTTDTCYGWDNVNRNFSYSFNCNVGHPAGKVSMKLTAILRPAGKILIYEENAPNDEWSVAGGASCIADLPSGRHGTAKADQGVSQADLQCGLSSNNIWMTAGRGNFCFFDGHVESLSPAQILLNVQKNWNNWYSPLTQ